MTKRRKYITISVVVLFFLWLINGWYQGMKQNKMGGDKAEFALLTVGDLNVPISATGSVEPESRAELKCKASGTVQKVYFAAGDMVHKGDLLVELDPVDEQRTVDNGKAEVERVEASLRLSKLEAEKIERDWPEQVLTALGNLESTRARLQGVVISFKRQDAIRLDVNPRDVTLNLVDPATVEPVELKGMEDSPLLQRAAKTLALAAAEAKAVDELVDYGKSVINENKVKGDGGGYRISYLEYQDALINMWQSQANLMMSLSDVYNAVNMYYMVEQAQTRVKVSEEALNMSRVAFEQAKQRLIDTKLYAPQDGLVQEVYVKEGQIISSGVTTVTGGTTLLTLAGVDKLYVEADVDEADIGRVRDLAPLDKAARLIFANMVDGKAVTTQPELTPENIEEIELLRSLDNVNITVEAFREDKFTGKVDRVYPNPKNVNNIVTYKVRILLTSDNRNKLMLGMHANVEFTSRKLIGVLLAPVEAIKSKNEEHGVYIEGEGPGAKPIFVPVKVGLTDSEIIELKTDKLKEGDKVYTKLPKIQEEDEEQDD